MSTLLVEVVLVFAQSYTLYLFFCVSKAFRYRVVHCKTTQSLLHKDHSSIFSTVDPDIFVRALFLRITLKDILVM